MCRMLGLLKCFGDGHSEEKLTMKPLVRNLIIMKRLLTVSFFTLLMWSAIFISCSKRSSPDGSPTALQQTMDTLTGREFEFNNLTWKEIDSYVMVEIANRPDLFFNPFRTLKVTIRLDTSAVWLNVYQDNGSYPAGLNFFLHYWRI